MLCPACDGVEMFVLEFERVEVDYCPECRGVWLDSGELALIGRRAGVLHGDLLGALEAQKGAGASGKAAARRCPVCRKRLREVRTRGAEPIVVDRCPRRHGLWFDRGELEGVVRAAGAEEANVLARFFAELSAPPEADDKS